MTPFHDLFVGLVAIVVGCLLIAGAVVESPTLMALAKARRLSQTRDWLGWIFGKSRVLLRFSA
ncbi:MAG: hypothetical protein JF612_04790 [Planctomycetia bacterium]|nr:hypothetical protein [Planctomycetia bacterium]